MFIHWHFFRIIRIKMLNINNKKKSEELLKISKTISGTSLDRDLSN
jgi:hypothetical protein